MDESYSGLGGNRTLRVKQNIKQFIKWLGKAVIAGTGALVCLSIFCLGYTYDGVHIVNPTGATDYIWEPGQLKATMKEGFSWLFVDSQGFNNTHDTWEEPDILLMGSSNMEAMQVDQDENTASLLNELIPTYTTYNIGMSGHTIYRCIDNMEKALETHKPKKYVVLVTDSIDLSIDEMQSVIDGTAMPIPSYNSGLVYKMQKVPAIKAIYKQMADWLVMQNSTTKNEDISSFDENTYKHTLNKFLEKASQAAKKANVTLIIAYQPMQSLETDGTITYLHQDKNIDFFKQSCDINNIVFSDLTNDFQTLYDEQFKLAHGFSNTTVSGGHLNKDGHQVVAKTIASKIKELEAE